MTGIIRLYVVHLTVEITGKFELNKPLRRAERPDLRVTDHAVQHGVFTPSIDVLAYRAHNRDDRH